MSIATATITVNAAFFREIKEVNDELWRLLADVQHLCSRPISLRSQCGRLVGMLSQSRDQIALHFALEEAYGYFEEPLYAAPRLSEQADLLRSEHRDLYAQINDLAELAEQCQFDGRLASLAAEVCRRFDSFYAQLLQHEARENELIIQAYGEDIGVGD